MAGGARGRSGSLARHLGLAARELELEAGVGQDPGRCGAAVVELLPLAALRVRLDSTATLKSRLDSRELSRLAYSGFVPSG